MAQQLSEGVLVLENKSRLMLKGKKGFWIFKRAPRSLSYLVPKVSLAWGGSPVPFSDPAEHWVAALLTPQFMLGPSAPGGTVGPGWARTGRRCGPALAIGHAENVRKVSCAVLQTLPGLSVAPVTPLY